MGKFKEMDLLRQERETFFCGDEQPAPMQEPVAWDRPIIYTPPHMAPPAAQPAPVQELTNIERHEQNVQKFLAAQPTPVQEPVAWVDVDENGAMSSLRYWSEPDNRHEVALYTAPPAAQPAPKNAGAAKMPCGAVVGNVYDAYEAGKKVAQPAPWVGLAASEIHNTDGYEETRQMYSFARAIEAKLKEKNRG